MEIDAAELPREARDAPALCALIAERAGAILRGDVSSFAALLAARPARRRDDNRRRFGTTTGETPRFDHRPSLDELFSDATNDGMVTARVYQGVWDYRYGVVELATHLRETPEKIEQRLATWDSYG